MTPLDPSKDAQKKVWKMLRARNDIYLTTCVLARVGDLHSGACRAMLYDWANRGYLLVKHESGADHWKLDPEAPEGVPFPF